MSWIKELVDPKQRSWEQFYRNRWEHDAMVRSTHGVNCTGGCSWNVYVKEGIVTWEMQALDYPRLWVAWPVPGYHARGVPQTLAVQAALHVSVAASLANGAERPKVVLLGGDLLPSPGAQPSDGPADFLAGYVGGGLQMQTDLAIDPAGNVWVMNNWQDIDSCFGTPPVSKLPIARAILSSADSNLEKAS